MFRLFLSRPLSLSDAAPWVTPEELAAAAVFPPVRQSEWLAWRAVVRRELCRELGCAPAEIAIGYNVVGAPAVEIPLDRRVYLAVSHCKGCVAVGLSDAPCAVDVESLDRRFGRIESRYMTAAERVLSDDPRWPAVVWCAKETLYKFAGGRELDLLSDLLVEQADFAAGRLVGRIRGGAALPLHFLFFAGRVIVFLV